MAGDKRQSILKSIATEIALPNGQRVLFVDVLIQCPDCGTQMYRIMGHHLRAVRDAIIAELDRFPDPALTGEDAQVQRTDTISFTPSGGSDPSRN